jgi:GTP cyclohydrolase I
LAKLDRRKIEEATRLFLEGIGQDPNDPNFRDTPKRVARLWKELLSPKRVKYTTFPDSYGSMVILRGHKVHGVCPHHLLPVEMSVYVGYIPNAKVLGLSKLARVAEEQLNAPITQETFTNRIAERLAVLDPKGIAVVVSGRHGCMRHRGVRTNADVITSAMQGVYLTNPTARQEFLQLVGCPEHLR